MIIEEQFIKGLFVINGEPFTDSRGAFERIMCVDTFWKFGLNTNFVQSNISYNKSKNTLRGMHFQMNPSEEEKLVKCISGSIYDVIVDLRTDSPTKHKWFSIVLSENDHKSIYIPKGCAHGFLTLEDNSNVLYYMSERYDINCATGIHYLDPLIQIEWPIDNNQPLIISEKDFQLPFVEGGIL